MKKTPTQSSFVTALRATGKPKGKQLKFLRAHAQSTQRIQTASKLAKAAGYTDWRGINLQYGLLAKRIGTELGRPDADLGLLVVFLPPKSLTNRDWLMVMRPRFAAPLRKADWI